MSDGEKDDEDEKNGSVRVKVCVRVRPFIREELDGSRCDDKQSCDLCVAMPTKTRVELNGDFLEKPLKIYEFDRCYWSHDEQHELYATQETLYDELGETLLNHAIGGFNNCIFAYGQTGSGKSHSVLGSDTEAGRGLLPRIVQGLFDHFTKLREENITCKCLVSFLEIYNEQIRDLLAQQSDKDGEARLDIRVHPVLGMVIPGLTEAAVDSCDQVLDLVKYGETMRHVAETAMNSNSSRSHCIFTLKTNVAGCSGVAKISQTHLVDLAGSERAKRTRATGERLREGITINKSLATLARVISTLAKKKKKSQPPFRDSRLTFMLKESLCGNSRTVMVAAIAPSTADYHETLSTLQFAKSVKEVQTRAVVNEVNEKSIEKQLRMELSILREKLLSYEAQQGQDAAKLSFAQRRLAEQEKLCMAFGQDWDTLLAAERRRNIHRMAIVSMDPASLEELQAISLKAEQEASSSSSDSSDSSSSSSDEDFVPIVDLEQALGERARRNTKIAIWRRKSVGGEEEEEHSFSNAVQTADRLTSALRQLMSEISEAEQMAFLLTASDAPPVQLRPLIAIDPETGNNELVICVRREHSAPEWLSDEDFRARLAWLHEESLQRDLRQAARASAGSEDAEEEPPPYYDAWASAEAATKVSNVLRLGSSPGGLSEESSPGGFAQSSQLRELRGQLSSCRAENDALRAELSLMRAELAKAQRAQPAEEAVLKTLLSGLSPKYAELSGASPLLRAQRIAVAVAADTEGTIGWFDEAEAALSIAAARRGDPIWSSFQGSSIPGSASCPTLAVSAELQGDSFLMHTPARF